MSWICTGSQYSETSHSCEHCAHGINNLFFIRNTETGACMVVGSDCVQHFCSVEGVASAAKLSKRITRANRQWRENKPARRENETKEAYVNRRLVEMANAMKAFNAWQALFQNRTVSIWSITRKRLQEKGLPQTGDNAHAEQIAFYSEFEATHQANMFDFNRAIWDVRKI